MMRLSLFSGSLLLLSALLVATVQSAPAARRDSARVGTILMLGDSLTDGYGLSRKQAYPALVQEKIRAAGLRYEVVNAGISGDTTAGGLRRIQPHLNRRIDVLVLALGINDAFRGVPVSQMRENLQGIIDRVRAKNPNVQVVIAGMQLPEFGADGYVRTFGQMFRELADKNAAALLPYLLEGVGGDPALNLPDRIHPNSAGMRVLAENVWRVLEPVLQKRSPVPVARVQ
ncbi:MAG: arylesterase [Chthoniobacterales bacterium]|nr:arylesterase [Chthoniobacterales bacterium]